MHPYPLLIAGASLLCAACAGAVYLQAPDRRPLQLLGLLLLGFSVWALSQVLGHLAGDAGSAIAVRRLAAPGWVFTGPLALHIFMEMSEENPSWLRHVRSGLYAASLAQLALAWATPWVLATAVPAPWGWRSVGGPLFGVCAGINLAGVALGARVGWRIARRLSPSEQQQLPWIAAAVAIPVVIVTATDVVLPMAGLAFPRLGTLSIGFLAATIVWVVVRFGYTMFSPGTFAAETLAILPDGVALVRPDERIRFANQGLARISGHPLPRLEGMPVGELLAFSFDADAVDEANAELTRAGGARIPVSINSVVLRDRVGNAIGRVLVVRDLREVADLRSRLITSARLAAVGELAAGIAHEINNPIAFVRSNLTQLGSHWKSMRGRVEAHGVDAEGRAILDEGDELLEECLEGVDRAAEIVRGVRGFAHTGSANREAADVNGLLDDVLSVASPQLRNRATVKRHYGDLPAISCSPQQLKQVFLNLVVNAGQAIEDGGTIRVATREIDGEVRVSVSDDGSGIAPEIMDRIFDPFFTTKRVGEGTGLGLGIAHQIVEAHGGRIDVQSEPGHGARFDVFLPVG